MTRSTAVVVIAAHVIVALGSQLALGADHKVEGKVKLGDKQLAAGRVLFLLDDSEFVGSKIKDGKFAVTRLPAGTFKVVIEGEGIPKRYFSEDKSGLQISVPESGHSVIDIQLQPD